MRALVLSWLAIIAAVAGLAIDLIRWVR